MREIKTYCDHCGKLLDIMHDYPDTEICIDSYAKADLCKECLTELDNIVLRFIKKGGVKE